MDRATERYLALIDRIGDDMGCARGWKRRAADRLGVHPSYISKLASREITRVGASMIERAHENMGVPMEYFYADVPPAITVRPQPKRESDAGIIGLAGEVLANPGNIAAARALAIAVIKAKG